MEENFIVLYICVSLVKLENVGILEKVREYKIKIKIILVNIICLVYIFLVVDEEFYL